MTTSEIWIQIMIKNCNRSGYCTLYNLVKEGEQGEEERSAIQGKITGAYVGAGGWGHIPCPTPSAATLRRKWAIKTCTRYESNKENRQGKWIIRLYCARYNYFVLSVKTCFKQN